MTPSEFAAAWKDIAPKLRAAAAAAADSIDDVVQETAVRAFVAAHKFDSPIQLAAWSRKTAFHLAVDARRRSIRESAPMPELAVEGVEAEALAHASLRQVTRAFSELSRKDRQAILAAVNGQPSSGTEAVRRWRARARLTALAKVGGVAAVFRAARPVVRRVPLAVRSAVAFTAVAVAGTFVASVVGSGPSNQSHPAAQSSAAPLSPNVLSGSVAAPAAGLPKPTTAASDNLPKKPTTPATAPSTNVHVDPVQREANIGGVGTRPSKPHEPLVCVNVMSRQCTVEVPNPDLPVPSL